MCVFFHPPNKTFFREEAKWASLAELGPARARCLVRYTFCFVGKLSDLVCKVILLRMVELSGGNIFIDGVNIREIGLHVLRSKVAIIPQEPTLFSCVPCALFVCVQVVFFFSCFGFLRSCSIRENLDPFNHYSDEQVWEVLSMAGMKEAVEKDGGLAAPVTEDGTNYSLGQRQLLCMVGAFSRCCICLLFSLTIPCLLGPRSVATTQDSFDGRSNCIR